MCFAFFGRRGWRAELDYSGFCSLNRGMKALGASFGRRGFGYVVALSVIVVLAGAAGILAFENETEDGIKTYGDALWWTAMMITTIGSEYFPKTAEGRILCFLIALYGFAVFGYDTATPATFLAGALPKTKNPKLSARKASTFYTAKSLCCARK